MRSAIFLLGLLAALFCAGCTTIEHGNVSFDVSPDGDAIAFSASDGDLYLWHISRGLVERVTDTSIEESTPAFSPDGQRLAFAADVQPTGKALFEYSLDTRRTRQLTTTVDVSDFGPRYSPDGSRVAFSRAHRHRPYSMGGWKWDRWDVYVIDSDGGHERRLTSSESYNANVVTFVNGGRRILFSVESSREGAVPELASVALAGGDPQTMDAAPSGFHGGAWAASPSASTDGTLVALLSDRTTPYSYDVFLMQWPSGRMASLGATKIARYNSQPVFSPDGATVYFLAGENENAGGRAIYSLWRVDVRSGATTRVADSGMFTHPLKWRGTQ